MNENVYFECRKKAAIHNERLNSRAGAADILGISESTLAHYECEMQWRYARRPGLCSESEA